MIQGNLGILVFLRNVVIMLARARPLTSPLPSVPLSASPWTPGARYLDSQASPSTLRRNAKRRETKKSSKALQQGFPLKVMLPRHQNVTNVIMKQLLKRGWANMSEWSTKQLLLLVPPNQQLDFWLLSLFEGMMGLCEVSDQLPSFSR